MIAELNTLINRHLTNEEIQLQRLLKGKEFLQWTIKKYKRQFEGEPKYVHKNEIFYCQLGYNIGSEQGGERPVVILQVDKANINTPTTIVIPITLHQGEIKEIEEEQYVEVINSEGIKCKEKIVRKVKVLETFDDAGNKQVKKLDFYEIPIEIEPGSRKNIKGFMNIKQIRTVSKKRLDKFPVAKITKKTENNIYEALKKVIQEE